MFDVLPRESEPVEGVEDRVCLPGEIPAGWDALALRFFWAHPVRNPHELTQLEGVDRLATTFAEAFEEHGDVHAAHTERDLESLQVVEHFVAGLAVELEQFEHYFHCRHFDLEDLGDGEVIYVLSELEWQLEEWKDGERFGFVGHRV